MSLILKDIIRFHNLLCFNVLAFFYSKMSHRLSQNPHTGQKRQNGALRNNMNTDAFPNNYGGSCLAKVHCLNHQRIGVK